MRYSNRPKRIVRLTESDLTRIIRRVINEEYKGDYKVIETTNLPEPTQEELGRIYVTERPSDKQIFLFVDTPRGNAQLSLDMTGKKASVGYGSVMEPGASRGGFESIDLKLSQRNLEKVKELYKTHNKDV